MYSISPQKEKSTALQNSYQDTKCLKVFPKSFPIFLSKKNLDVTTSFGSTHVMWSGYSLYLLMLSHQKDAITIPHAKNINLNQKETCYSFNFWELLSEETI